MDEREMSQAIAEIREWLVEINANQKHQTDILTEFKATATNAFHKADDAEDKANKALELAMKAEQDLKDYKDSERTGRRWLIGIFVSIFLALLPILNSFYM